MQKLPWKTFTAYFVAYFVVFAWAPSTRSSSLVTSDRGMQSAVVLFSFAFFLRAQRGRDGQSPDQNLEKFSLFEFLNICTWEWDYGFEMVFEIVPLKHRKRGLITVLAYSHLNTLIDQWECAYCLNYFIKLDSAC